MTADSSQPPSSETTPRLRRELGLLSAIGIGLGAVIGAGLFVVTGLAAEAAGPAFLIGLAVAGAAAICNGLSSAQLAAVYPQSGGTYEYGCRLLHPWLGFAAGWMFLVSKLAAGGTVALGLGSYLAQLAPGLNPRWVGAVAVVLLTLANWRGVQKTGQINTAIVAVTLTVLLGFVAAGWSSFDLARLEPFMPHSWTGVAESSALLFFAYTGYARLATLGEEVKEPGKNIPRAVIATLIISLLLYVAVGFIAVGAIGAEGMAKSPSPLQRAAETFSIPGMAGIVTFGAATAMLGVLLSQILGISRMMLAMARRRDLPQFLSHIHARHTVPDRAIWLTGGIILVIGVSGGLSQAVSMAAFSILIYYGITNVAALRLPYGERRYPSWIAGLGLVFCLAMAGALPGKTIGLGLAVLAAGFAARCAIRRDAAG